MAVVRWIFYDATTATTYTVPVNPNEGGTPHRKKSLRFQNTAAPNGKVLVFEGRNDPTEIQFSGTILEQAHLEALDEWYEKRHQIRVTDDLGRMFWIYLTDFEATRQRSALHPWKHTYTARATVVDWA